MLDEEEIKKIISSMQTSLHDQISALKADVQKAVGDSDAALEISATLEKTINKLTSEKIQTGELAKDLVGTLKIIEAKEKRDFLNFRRLQMLAGMSQLSWNLSMRMLVVAILRREDEQKQLYYFEQLLALVKICKDFSTKILDATTVEEEDSLWLEFSNRYFAIQDQTVTKE
jgi:hypothetical protein